MQLDVQLPKDTIDFKTKLVTASLSWLFEFTLCQRFLKVDLATIYNLSKIATTAKSADLVFGQVNKDFLGSDSLQTSALRLPGPETNFKDD